ncbi:MAG: hypothetical protein WDM76_05190 [Limisphaerales bacterium]
MNVWQWGASVGGHSGGRPATSRTVGASMSGIGFKQDAAAPFAQTGNWNDPDMLIVGKLAGAICIRPA